MGWGLPGPMVPVEGNAGQGTGPECRVVRFICGWVWVVRGGMGWSSRAAQARQRLGVSQGGVHEAGRCVGAGLGGGYLGQVLTGRGGFA